MFRNQTCYMGVYLCVAQTLTEDAMKWFGRSSLSIKTCIVTLDVCYCVVTTALALVTIRLFNSKSQPVD